MHGVGRAVQWRRLWADRHTLTFDDLLLGCALAVLLAVACWLALAVALTLAARAVRHGRAARTASGRRLGRLLGALADRVTPALCRAVLAGVGSAALAAPGAAAVAQPAAPGVPGSSSALPLPDRPVRPSRPVTSAGPSEQAKPPLPVVVRRGDTLWAIAARRLPAHPDAAAISAAWPVWFHVNRARLGPDPDRIHPGTRLAVPQRFRRADKDQPR